MVFQRNGATRFTIHDGYTLFNFLRAKLYNQFASAVEYVDIRVQDADSTMRVFVGNSANQNLQRTSTETLMRRETQFTGIVQTNTVDTYTMLI